MKRERVIELWLAGFVLVVGLIVVVVLLGTAAADGPPMSERAALSFSPIHNLLPTNNVYAFGHLGVVGNKIKKNNFEVDPLCNEQDGCYPYGDGCEERDYYCAGNGTGCNYTFSNRHNDSWVDTGNTRWVDVDECEEKEQKEQEYWDYKCSAGSCNYRINDMKWLDTGIYNTTCNCVSLAPPEITSFAPLSYVDDTVCNWRTFDVTTNQAANVSWYLNDMLVLTNESVREAKCTLHADVVGVHSVTAIASNANGSDMQMWIWAVTELPKECEGTDTCCGCYPNCENCNEQDGCYPHGDGCEERDYYCAGNGTGCNYTSSNRHNDSWVDTGNTRWVDENECKQKEQKEQEYRDYKCSAGSCNYTINDTKWLDTGNTSIKANGTICGCTANNTVKRCYDGNCTDTGIGNSSNCCADVACDGKKPGESCGDGRICNSTCNCVSLAPPGITSFAPLSYVDDTVGKWRAFNVTVNQAANVSWYLNGTLVLTNESVREAKCTLHADVVDVHNVTAIASNANGSDMQMWIWVVTELPKECEGTDTCCGCYPNCGNCNEQDGCYPHGDGCEERDYYCAGNGTGCNYTSSNRHNDSWEDTGNTRWVDENECKQKEQKEQEYRDYKCSAGSCNYSINDTKWIDTGIYNTTCNGVSLAPPEITSFAPLSYVDDTVGNWRAFNVTVSQTANVSWYLNDTLVLTNESVREAKCTLHAEVVGEHNVTAIASNANGSDMQTWIWAVTSETQTIGTGTKTITQTINVSNSFPMFSNAEYVHFTIGNDNITLTLDDNASFDGVCNLSDLMGRDVSVAGRTVELEYFPITYQNHSHDQKWVSAPFFDDAAHKLYLLYGSGLTTLDLKINENSTTTPIPKVVGVGSTVGQFQMETVAEGSNSNHNWLKLNIKGVGYADLYVQYAPDTSYENTPFLPTFSQCEKLEVSIDSSISGSESMVDVMGVVNGAEPIPRVSHDWNLSLELDVEYFPITYQNHTHDQKWAVYPSFDDTEHKLHLLSGSGLITRSGLIIEENSATTPIPKVVGVGSTVGDFKIQTFAEGSNSNYNWLESNIKGVGYADLYVQYAPDTSYENTPFLPTISQCERLLVNIDSSISGSESKIAYEVDVKGVANGAEPIPRVSHDWHLKLQLDVEYFPITYQNHSYDQKWDVYPSFDDTEHKLHLLSGSGLITRSGLIIEENSATTPIPKVVGVGSTVGDFKIQTFAEGSNSNYNWLESNIKGIGYENLYAQYAPDTSYEDITFIPTFSQCEQLELNTHSNGSVVTCEADMLGVSTGSGCLMFNGTPLDMVTIDETFDLTYHPVIISGDEFDEKWSVEPEQYEDTLVILRGTGAMTALNFIFNDSTAAHPEISSYGYLRGDYNITANILPHYMDVVANGPDVAAMDESEQGGFGVNFSGEPSPCFIATAAYGTPLHEDINVLRKFRDEYLMPNPAGQAMVKIYYTTSPPVADLIRANEGLRTTVRDGLVKPLVDITRMFVE